MDHESEINIYTISHTVLMFSTWFTYLICIVLFLLIHEDYCLKSIIIITTIIIIINSILNDKIVIALYRNNDISLHAR